MSRVAIDLGFIQIYWYTVFILISVLVAGLVAYVETKKQNIDQEFFINLLFYTVIIGIIGARLYYVIFNWSYYSKNIIEIFEIWNGGLAIHGGIIAGGLFAFFYSRKYNINTFKLIDIMVVSLIIGQAIGRWGNFFNQEAFGPIIEKEFLLGLNLPSFIIDGMYINGNYHHPTFLYESIWNVFGFILLLLIRKFKKYLKTGQLTGVYMIWYSIGRLYIEGLRTDSLMLGNIKVAQLVSILMIIMGVALIIIRGKGSRFDNLYKENKNEK